MNNLNALQAEILKVLSQSNKILLTTHTNPDGDAIGSTLALYHYLKTKEKNVKIVISDEVPRNLKFLADSSSVETYNSSRHDHFIKTSDTIVFLDLNEVVRTRLPNSLFASNKSTTIVIDHHTAPRIYPNYMYSDPNCSSTGELVYNILRADPDFKLTREIAEALYVAIMTDTGSFRFQRTNSTVHRIIADLIDAGAEPYTLYDKVYNQNPLKIVRLLGLAISKMQVYFDGKVCIMIIDKNDFAATGTNFRDTEFFVERTLSVEGVEIGILLTEVIERGEFKISFRSKNDINVSTIARALGGGGHINAAGATIKSHSLEDALQSVMNQLTKFYS